MRHVNLNIFFPHHLQELCIALASFPSRKTIITRVIKEKPYSPRISTTMSHSVLQVANSLNAEPRINWVPHERLAPELRPFIQAIIDRMPPAYLRAPTARQIFDSPDDAEDYLQN